VLKRVNTINLFLLGVASSARHDAISNLPSTIPNNQILARRHKSPSNLFSPTLESIDKLQLRFPKKKGLLLADCCLSRKAVTYIQSGQIDPILSRSINAG
jgi:hypothetical protein